MSIEISSIEVKALRKAAEKADDQGNLDGKLNENEFNVFAKEAYNKGCSSSDVLQVTGDVAEGSAYAETLQKIKNVEAKEKELEHVKNLLQVENENKRIERADSEGYDNAVAGVAGLAGGALGFGALIGLSAIDKGLNYKFAAARSIAQKAGNIAKANKMTRNIHKLSDVGNVIFGKTTAGGIARIGAVVVAGAAAGVLLSKMFNLSDKVGLFKPHKAKVAQKKANEYEQQKIEPLKAQKEQLEQEIKEMKSQV